MGVWGFCFCVGCFFWGITHIFSPGGTRPGLFYRAPVLVPQSRFCFLESFPVPPPLFGLLVHNRFPIGITQTLLANCPVARLSFPTFSGVPFRLSDGHLDYFIWLSGHKPLEIALAEGPRIYPPDPNFFLGTPVPPFRYKSVQKNCPVPLQFSGGPDFSCHCAFFPLFGFFFVPKTPLYSPKRLVSTCLGLRSSRFKNGPLWAPGPLEGPLSRGDGPGVLGDKTKPGRLRGLGPGNTKHHFSTGLPFCPWSPLPPFGFTPPSLLQFLSARASFQTLTHRLSSLEPPPWPSPFFSPPHSL